MLFTLQEMVQYPDFVLCYKKGQFLLHTNMMCLLFSCKCENKGLNVYMLKHFHYFHHYFHVPIVRNDLVLTCNYVCIPSL